MTFLVTLIALLIERFFAWSQVRRWQWFARYENSINNRFIKFSPLLRLTLCVLPLVLIVAWINILLTGKFYELLKLVFNAAILVYCLGPRNFWVDVYACMKDVRDENMTSAIEHLKNIFNVTISPNEDRFHTEFLQTIFVKAHTRIFAVIFWYILLGPAGALLYRLIQLSTTSTFLQTDATRAQNILDWLPARVYTFIFALAGHFVEVLHQFQQGFFKSPTHNDTYITDCGIAALNMPQITLPPKELTPEKEALALVDRVFVIGLVFLAICVLLT